MDMERDTLTIANLIFDHYLASGNKYVGVPVNSFEQRKLGHHDVKITLSILIKNGAIQSSYHRCWGHTILENGSTSYVEVSETKPRDIKDDDGIKQYEAYHITVEPNALKQFVGQPQSATKPKKEGVVELFLNNEGDLYKEPKNKFCYPLQKNQEPLRVVLYFIKNPNSGYQDSTQMIALSLGKDPQYLRAEIGKINRIAINRLGLVKEKLIQAKQNSGYRLNPKIKIIAEKEILSR